IIAEFNTKYPTSKHITWDAVSFSGIRKANMNSFGKAIIPTYNFDKANVIVSISADFLTNWLSPIEFASQYAQNRKVSKEKQEMSKHIQFETILTVSGANADMRQPIKPSEEGLVAVNLYNAVAKQMGMATLPSSVSTYDEAITKVAAELAANKGKSLVIAGSNDPAIQMVVNEINKALGNYNNVINIDKACNLRQGNDEDFANLVKEMKDGKVDVLITYNTNPAYTAPAAIGFKEAWAKVLCKVSLADRLDETASSADYVCPDHHYLESWGDSNPYEGVYSLTQPAIYPLFSKPRYEGTRSAAETFMKWAGMENADHYSYIVEHWKKDLLPAMGDEGGGYMFTELWNKTLQTGVYEKAAAATEEIGTAHPREAEKEAHVEPVAEAGKMTLAEAASSIASTKGSGVEVVLYEKTGIGNGNQANNPWLHELPDP
ncbi:MAG TPA: molybdopterin oxidoreductase, partial [Bacteroidia bacterium]|nr:molybdopterin oxidoreductase [Bacteroidia bacterium]